MAEPSRALQVGDGHVPLLVGAIPRDQAADVLASRQPQPRGPFVDAREILVGHVADQYVSHKITPDIKEYQSSQSPTPDVCSARGFVLAQYVQTGLGRSPLISGLILVPWVAAFGLAGQLTRRLPTRMAPYLPAASYLLLTAAYVGIGTSELAGQRLGGGLAVLLGLGGLGLGGGFATLLTHLTNSTPARYAPDISGVATTTMQIGGAVGVAAFGGVYLTLAAPAGPAPAAHAFGVTSFTLAAVGLVATAAAYLATRRPANREQRTGHGH